MSIIPLQATALKVFVPSKDYAESLQFYQALGFELVFDTGSLCELQMGTVAFLLQDFYEKELASNLMLQLSVTDLDAWHNKLTELQASKPELKLRFQPPKEEAWGRVLYLWGPAGELWYIK